MALSQDERYEDLKTRVEDLEDRYRNMSRRISVHDLEIDELGKSMDTSGRALRDLRKRMDTGFEATNRSFDVIRHDIEGSFAQNAAYQLQQDNRADARHARILENFDRVWINFKITDDRFTALHTSLSEMEERQNAQFSAMQTDISTMQADITALKASQAAMQADITALKASQAAMQGDIAEMKGALALILERLPAPKGE